METKTELGHAYRWNAAFNRVQEVRARCIKEAETSLPPGTRYELRLAPKQLSPDYVGLEQGLCWYWNKAFDDEGWEPGDTYRDGYRIERRIVGEPQI